ncbi:alpha/beta hydrolase [Aequorivita sp. SDUM287046]|uniref:Alpha/beta hydrolase n=1 Tax=Aequorivita aurantiaca TaxID=3053356 RepID=A0ABT8DHY0_9FLAO|nr:alpha/beta hydrolase [Aequorivita aurantiaca]MDN3724512.1 alpha/beta hydrolase [Aequorivita aurantiaca]
MRKIIVLFFFLILNQTFFSQQHNYIFRSDSKIHYQTFGKGKPILIINGGPGMSSEGFVQLATELSKNNQTILYDQRGTGLSTINKINKSTITMDLMVEDIEVLREHLQLESWIIMGHSFGGMLAYYYASKFPKRVEAMIQSSSGGMNLAFLSTLNTRERLSQPQQDSLLHYENKILNGDNSYQTRLKRGLFLAPAYLYNKKYVPTIAARLTQGNSQINNLVWEDLQKMPFNVTKEMASYKNPVILLHGANDIVPIEIAKNAKIILSNSLLIIFEESGHYGWLEEKEKFFSETGQFLKSINNKN